MSKICLALITNKSPEEEIRVRIKEIVNHAGYEVFFYDRMEEPIIDEYLNSFIISFADSKKHDNCEMLLLPDGWYHNGITSSTPFISRVRIIESAIKELILQGCHVDLFIGDSGTLYEEFSHYKCNINEFSHMISTKFANGIDIDLHISFA